MVGMEDDPFLLGPSNFSGGVLLNVGRVEFFLHNTSLCFSHMDLFGGKKLFLFANLKQQPLAHTQLALYFPQAIRLFLCPLSIRWNE